MTVGILIAVGGTGAKVAEAMVHACAAGLGPSELIVGFVDQDAGNGNTGRARRAVELYAQAREAWRDGGAHALDDECELLRPAIRLLDPNHPIWTPHPDGSMTLNRATGNRDALDDRLFDLLFEGGAAEQDMPLGIGYRGRANVGAAAIALAARGADHPFLRSLDTAMKRAAQGAPVRLVIAGSLFGGTGAAGFPTLARLLRQQAPPGLERAAFAMAGALMLPYFGFPPPAAATGDAANVAVADALLLQSRAALRYYHELQQDGRLPFDRLYLSGWDRFFPLPEHHAGTGEQLNPAMMPELFAALGACRFMRDGDPAPERAEIQVCSRATTDALTWTDLPGPGQDPLEPYRRLGPMIRFGVAWDYWSRYAQRQGAMGKRLFLFNPRRDPFFIKQELGRIDWVREPPEREMATLGDWSRGVLDWAAQLAAWPDQLGRFDLWSLQRFRPGQDEAAYDAAFNAAVIAPAAADPPSTASGLNDALSSVAGPAKAIGLGKLVSRIHAACAV